MPYGLSNLPNSMESIVLTRLVPTSNLTGLGDNTLTVQSVLSDKVLAYFATKFGEPVLYIPSVISSDEFDLISESWRQYRESHQRLARH